MITSKTVSSKIIYKFLEDNNLYKHFKAYKIHKYGERCTPIEYTICLQEYYKKMSLYKTQCIFERKPFVVNEHEFDMPKEKPTKDIAKKTKIQKVCSNPFKNLYGKSFENFVSIMPYFKQCSSSEEEHFVLIGLETENTEQIKKIVFVEDVTIESNKSSATISFRNIFKSLFDEYCLSFIVFHNHPTKGVLYPSEDDLKTTKQLTELGELFECPLVDHYILSGDKYISLKNLDCLNVSKNNVKKKVKELEKDSLLSFINSLNQDF